MTRARRLFARGLLFAGALGVLAWLLGRICSDRWVWSQWLLWLPAAVMTPALGLMAAGLLLRRARRWLIGVCALAAVAAPGIDVLRLWRPNCAPNGSLRVLHWTAGPQMRSTDLLKQVIEQTDPHLVVVLGARRASAGEALANWGVVPGPLSRGEFMIFSKVPITTCRSLARSDDIQLVELVLASPWAMSILLVDLPSDPARSRWTIAQQTANLMSRTLPSEPDAILGDFNMTQASQALRSIRPDWALAWPGGGSGWGGTWPRAVPLWRIDHVLTPPDAPKPWVKTLDPGAGRHRAQIIEFTLP